MASLPVSPVRIRMTSSRLDTKIFPSPIAPVCEDEIIVQEVGGASASSVPRQAVAGILRYRGVNIEIESIPECLDTLRNCRRANKRTTRKQQAFNPIYYLSHMVETN